MKEVSDLMNGDQDFVLGFVDKHRKFVVAQIKELWKTQQVLEKAAFSASSSTGALCRSYFDTKGVNLEENGPWATWDSNFT